MSFQAYIDKIRSKTGKTPADFKKMADEREFFISQLKSHQQGKTDYFTFCKDCAEAGIEKWVVTLEEMTCTYFDKKGNEILVEEIPQ